MTPACALCGTPCRPPFQAPPPELAPDLDLRPGEPTRSTLPRWIMTCRGCGAAAPDLATLPRAAHQIVDSPDYQALTGPTAPFLRWAMLCDTRAEAAQAVLEAAWATDDADGDATPLRRRAAALWGDPATMQEKLRLIDILRRAGDFAAAETRATLMLAQPGLEETDAALLRYQLGLVAAQDTSRHLLSSALRPPAQRPHVTHGRPNDRDRKRSLWQRLAGR